MRKASFLILPLLAVILVPVAFAKEHRPDAQIKAEIQDKLYHARVFEHGNVEVSFANGTATLSGTVDSLGVKRDAERAAQHVDDVMGVVNNITVHAEDVSDAQIAREAQKEVRLYYAYTIFDWITLQVHHGTLVVNGEVSQPYKKYDIGNFLGRVKGVEKVENNLQILPTSIYDDQVRLEIARAIYNDPYFVHYAIQAVPSIHIIVKNGNVWLKGVVATKLDRIKADDDARFAATYFGLTDQLAVES
jgi:hyperosmotically inducible protein